MNRQGTPYTFSFNRDATGFTMFPSPLFWRYTTGTFSVARWYPTASAAAFPSLAAMTWWAGSAPYSSIK